MEWPLQDAKNQLSKLVKDARENGPQTITVRGKRTAVILSAEDYDSLRPDKPTLVDHLLSGPPHGTTNLSRSSTHAINHPVGTSNSDVSD